ncbi:BAG family molecular chaperone regulator 1 isoform X4 [Colius striatus]|uniref:BAG family molecular chaperone regulator 1 isoform X4 n=1 Tax=Colius striatus TaxID=57412 RepID=UPI002B1D479E|nr:BAG family molecular chaperone regulator 1 isoform X4 [Colius striatus]
MAAPGVPVIVTVTYSNEKHNIQVASKQEDGEPTLQDMAVLIEQVTGVPVPFQKLIYKGKSLKELEQPLSALGVKNGCKVMLIGKRNSPEEEAELKKLKDLEKSVEQIANKLEEVNKEFTGIQKGFLAKDLQTEALKQLDKRIKGTAEQFMKILEQIDAIKSFIWGSRLLRLHEIADILIIWYFEAKRMMMNIYQHIWIKQRVEMELHASLPHFLPWLL